jgi:hypothetical protein
VNATSCTTAFGAVIVLAIVASNQSRRTPPTSLKRAPSASVSPTYTP